MVKANTSSEERKFLHDLAGPLSAAMFSIEMALDCMGGQAGTDPEAMELLRKTSTALEEMRTKLGARREELIQKEATGKPA